MSVKTKSAATVIRPTNAEAIIMTIVEPFNSALLGQVHFFSSSFVSALYIEMRFSQPLHHANAKSPPITTAHIPNLINSCFPSTIFFPCNSLAEGEGFEPSKVFILNGFQDRRDRPLCHPSLSGHGRTGGIRTFNRRFWRPQLYQLSYCPTSTQRPYNVVSEIFM